MDTERVLVQPIFADEDVVRHPIWPHKHLVWKPIYVTGEEVLDLDRQKELYTGIALRALKDSPMEHAALNWDKMWVLSVPAHMVQ